VRFFRELKIFIDAEKADFAAKIASAESYDKVKYHLGYMDALEDVLIEGAEIERKISNE
jgi:hypothetical protein